MAIGATREALSRIFHQRCFWLFGVLLALIGAVSFVPPNDHGRLILNAVNMLTVIATIAAVGRTTLSFVIALLLAVPAVWFQYVGLWHDSDSDLAVSWTFSAALYFLAIAYLLRYVFQPRIMTQDKLFGAAAVYLLIGVLWILRASSVHDRRTTGTTGLCRCALLEHNRAHQHRLRRLDAAHAPGARPLHDRADYRSIIRCDTRRPLGWGLPAARELYRRRDAVGRQRSV
jgi:hypothetical protein